MGIREKIHVRARIGLYFKPFHKITIKFSPSTPKIHRLQPHDIMTGTLMVIVSSTMRIVPYKALCVYFSPILSVASPTHPRHISCFDHCLSDMLFLSDHCWNLKWQVTVLCYIGPGSFLITKTAAIVSIDTTDSYYMPTADSNVGSYIFILLHFDKLQRCLLSSILISNIGYVIILRSRERHDREV